MLETDDLVAVRNADLGFGGKIRNGRLIAMLGCKYDLFIDLNKENNALIKFVLQHTQASCIVGMKKEGRSGRYCDRRSDRTFRPCK